MKIFSVLLFLICFSLQSFAHHGKGGSIIYEYLGAGSAANTSKYKITVQHYINCDRAGDEPNNIYLGIFDGSTNALVTTINIPRTGTEQITKKVFDPCITNPPPSCFFYLDTYVTTTDLPDNTGGYILAEQECCRADAIVNVSNPSSVGFTNENSIPGVINGVIYRNNSSPALIVKDTAVICHGSYFTIDFGATDPDGDILSYSFCDATNSGSTTRQPDPPSSPPYASIPYASGYSGSTPFGSGVTIDSKTGLISGVAPATTGAYMIAVCITETRNGVQIGTTKKEVLVNVADCSLAGASLNVSYINCDNYTFSFKNETVSSNISSYYWDFGVQGAATDTSTQAAPTYTYADTGTYILKLRVTSTAGCSDSASSVVKVYPGFKPGFTATGSCYQSPFVFTNTTTVTYGSITNLSWNFGDASTTADTSSLQNPSYQYTTPGTATVVLNVASSKGCSGSYTDTVIINNKPAIYLPFTDTLICSKDSLPLIVQSSATSYSWSPAYNIINPNTANPLVFPKDTTVYTVTVKDKECIDSATVTVNVLDFITVKIIGDTGICKTDSITLRPVSDALSYTWKESTGLNSLSSYFVKYPKAAPLVNTTYYVTANLGYCQDSTKINVFVSPYPTVFAGNDTSICYGRQAQLNGSTNAPYFAWSPLAGLINANTLQPLVTPAATAAYFLTVRDTTYCTKNVTDSIVVTVIQPLKLNAGNDTSIVVGQPLQLSATYNSLYNYTWSPSTGMNNSNIYNPLITINSSNIDSITYKVTASSVEGCTSSDDIVVTVFKTLPDIFVPTAFTPNADGKNDLLKPVLVGITKLNYFRIYNRWGQLVYSSSESGKGWDGTFNGVQQTTGTFVFMAQGSDYTGKTIFRKGTSVLIR